ncbi:MAG: hypothetical protein LBD04_02860 [Synergistaceae bacterium]|jgi:hypothetical protein|nr:hypothetical protein [Synergistaceae bacterium]
MSKEALVLLCREWQKILRLRDWEIFLDIVRIWDMPPSALGHNKIDMLKKKSVIAVLDESDYSPCAA